MSMIEIQNLSKFYGAKRALDNLTFTLEKGKPVALVGPNGAGKTTLFSILCGYIFPSSGTVTIFGEKPGSNRLFGRLSALPQDAQLDPRFAISYQLEFYARLQGISAKKARIEAERVLDLVQLKEALNEKPAELSHGMRKRVAIAQALMGTPELVLLDEPSAGLDPVNARNIRDRVAELSDEVNFIISSHNLHELEQLCSSVLYLEQGKLSRQASVSRDEGNKGFLTILLGEQDIATEQIQQIFSQIAGFEKMTPSRKYEYLLQYRDSENPLFDQHLLAALAENNWNYRQLIKGKTLEEQLFSREQSSS